MDDICRLCLSFSSQNMVSLSECDASVTVLNIQLPSNDLYPNQICTMCLNKLTELKEFCQQVQKNEEMLINQLKQGIDCLNDFYKQIKHGIKKETKAIDDLVKENKMALKEIKLEEDSNIEEGVEDNSEFEIPVLEIKGEEHGKLERKPKCFTEFNFKCLTCFEKFEDQQLLVNHYNNVHKSKGQSNYCYSLITEDNKNLLKCDKCDKIYDNKKKMSKHCQVHTDERFHCKICSRTYRTVSEIIRHGRAHDGSKVSCSFGCGFATAYSGALKNHEDRHRKEFKYKCKTCNKSFQVKTWFEQHQNIHTGVKPFVCHICGLAFHLDRYLTSHRSTVHPNASPFDRYVCVQCSKPCGTMKALTLHLKEHGITPSLLCDLCGKTLSSSEQLKKHKLAHSGVKPYHCTLCDKSFAKKCNLKLHQITHTGVRAHACEACGKQYTQRSALLRHVNRHHSETNSCSKCDKAFANQTQLESHRKLCS